MNLIHVGKAALMNDQIYCVSGILGILYKVCLFDWTIENICELHFSELQDYVDVFHDGTNIWCVPVFGTRIAQYNFETGKVMYYGDECQKPKRRNGVNIFLENVIYMVPFKISEDMIMFDTHTRKFEIMKEWGEQMAGYDGNTIARNAFADSVLTMTLRSGTSYRWTKTVLQYNFTKKTQKCFVLPEAVCCIVQRGNDFYFGSTDAKKVLVWNEGTGLVTSYKCPYSEEGFYLRAFPLEEGVLFADGVHQDIFENGEFKPLPDIEGLKSYNEKGSLFITYVEWNSQLLLMPYNANMVLSIDNVNMQVQGHVVQIPDEDIISYHLRRHISLNENIFPLEDYIKAVAAGEENSYIKGISDSSIGAKILGKVLQEG